MAYLVINQSNNKGESVKSDDYFDALAVKTKIENEFPGDTVEIVDLKADNVVCFASLEDIGEVEMVGLTTDILNESGWELVTDHEELERANYVCSDTKWYDCPDWFVAMLAELANQMNRVYWNLNQSEYNSPFENTAAQFDNLLFQVEAYSWDDNYEQEYNFKCGDIMVRWYKHLRRDTQINGEYSPSELITVYDKCLYSILTLDRDDD